MKQSYSQRYKKTFMYSCSLVYTGVEVNGD